MFNEWLNVLEDQFWERTIEYFREDRFPEWMSFRIKQQYHSSERMNAFFEIWRTDYFREDILQNEWLIFLKQITFRIVGMDERDRRERGWGKWIADLVESSDIGFNHTPLKSVITMVEQGHESILYSHRGIDEILHSLLNCASATAKSTLSSVFREHLQLRQASCNVCSQVTQLGLLKQLTRS